MGKITIPMESELRLLLRPRGSRTITVETLTGETIILMESTPRLMLRLRDSGPITVKTLTGKTIIHMESALRPRELMLPMEPMEFMGNPMISIYIKKLSPRLRSKT